MSTDYLTIAGTRFANTRKTETIPGNIKTAMNQFTKWKYSRTVLFHMYCDLIGITEKSFTLWSDMKWGKGIPVINGVSVDETLLEKYVWAIRKVPADQLINLLFYSGNKNNSAFETGFLAPVILNRIPEDTYVLNPSSYIVQDTLGRCKGYIVWDAYFQKAYSHCFREDNFYRYDEIDSLDETARVVALLADEKDFDAIKQIIQFLGCKEVVVYTSHSLFKKIRKDLMTTARESKLSLQGVLMVDPDLIVSELKKHMVLFLSREKAEQHIPVRTLSADGDMMAISDASYSITHEYFHTGRMTTKDILDRNENSGEKKQRNRPEEYYFSKEIRIQVKYRKHGDKKSAIVSYSSIPDGTGKSRKLSRNIEKGLQFSDEDELKQKLDQALFLDELYEIIIEDIRQHYADRYETLSLKTLWYLYRNTLYNIDAYDDELCMDMFTRRDDHYYTQLQEIDYQELLTGTRKRSVIEKLLEGKSVAEKKRYIVQLNLLFSRLIQDKIFLVNPFREMIDNLSNRMSEEQYEVRNALTKKNLSIDEQRALLYENGQIDEWWMSESLKTIVISFRLLSGIPVREMLALRWSDLVENSDYGFYQIKVTKMIDRSGEHIVYGMQNDWRRFRLIPLIPELSMILFRRKRRWMRNYNLTEDQMDSIPIFSENYDRRRKTQKIISYEGINKICNAAIMSLNIPKFEIRLPGEKELITDLNRYYSDIFLSNFRFHANHICLMTRGEINYLLGLQQEDTYAKHYCDYTNDAIQFRMLRKLIRWSILLKVKNTESKESEEKLINCTEYQICAGKESTLQIKIHNRFGGTIRLRKVRKDTRDEKE